APDLTPTGLTAPATLVVGQTSSISWSVTNNSATISANAGWYDALYLSDDDRFDSNNDKFIANQWQGSQTPLAPNGSYNANLNVSIPTTPAGQRYLLVVTDYNRNQGETDETNNVYAVPITVTAPDLIVTSFVAPSSAIVGEEVDVSWTVKNVGNAPANADY